MPYQFTRRRNQLRPDFSGPILLFTPYMLYLAVHAPLIRTGVLLGLQSGWLSETIRTGDGRGSLPLDSVPHSICKAFHLWWSWGLCGVGERPRERQQGNRLCNVFGRVFFFFFLKYSQLALTSGRLGHPCSKFLSKCVVEFIRTSKHIISKEER